MSWYRKIFTVITLVIVSLGHIRGLDVAANQDTSHKFVWIQETERQSFEVLGLRPIIGLHYPTFSWY